MARHWTGVKPLSKAMLTRFIDTCICGTRGRWLKWRMFCVGIHYTHNISIFFSCQWSEFIIGQTRTTRMPAFWGYPPPPRDYPCHWVILDLKSKQDKVKVTNLKNFPKVQILKKKLQALQATHLLKLLDKMCKYEMDPTSIVEDTEQTRSDWQGETSIHPLYNFY